MGATVITGKRAAAFTAPSGAVIYVLFEESYEKNVLPHTPDWECRAIGALDRILPRIFGTASSCEGGSLQGRNGRITPEGYLRGWMKELATPFAYPDQGIVLKRGTGSLYDAIPPEAFPRVVETLTARGRADLVDRLTAGESITLRLHGDIDLLLAMYGQRNMAPWRMIRSVSPPFGERHPELGYKPTPAADLALHVPAVLRVDGENRLLQRPDGTWYCAGWAYRIVADYVASLGATELREPGSYWRRIRAYRDAVENARLVGPDEVRVLVDQRIPLTDEYKKRDIAEFARKYPVSTTDTGFEVQPTPETLYQLTDFPVECTQWIVADEAATPAAASLS